jgi:hypothetical protein
MHGLTGATAASRYVGATTSGAPSSGAFSVGDFVVDQGGTVWICITAGSPGTWMNPRQSSDFIPSDYSLLGWTGLPESMNQTFTPSAGVATYHKIKVPRTITIANVAYLVSTAGSGGSPANCFIAVYNSAGTQLGVSGSLVSAFQTPGYATAAITVNGGQSLTVAGGPNTYIWVGLLVGTQYTTALQLRGFGVNSGIPVNLGLTGTNMRSGSEGSGLSALPNSFTPGSLVSGALVWLGLS